MKQAILGFLCVVALAAGQAQGQNAPAAKEEPLGFASFKFGDTWAALRQQAIREYGLEKARGGFDSWRQPKEKGKLYFSFRDVKIGGEMGEKDLVIDHYVVAGKEYEVQFKFDSKERFDAYHIIEIPSVDLKDYDTIVADRLQRWKGLFGQQFGPPTQDGKLPPPQTLKVVHTPVTTWKFKNHTASIVVFHRGRSYNVHAVVRNDKLAAEEATKTATEKQARMSGEGETRTTRNWRGDARKILGGHDLGIAWRCAHVVPKWCQTGTEVVPGVGGFSPQRRRENAEKPRSRRGGYSHSKEQRAGRHAMKQRLRARRA